MSPTSYQTAPPRVATYVLAKNRPSAAASPGPPPAPRRCRSTRQRSARPRSRTPATSTILPVRVAVVDIGSNSTRLLIADVDPHSGSVNELERRSTVTRLGHGVDASGSLSDDAIERVLSTLREYRTAIDAHDATANLAVLTSAVRDASNGPDFAARVRQRLRPRRPRTHRRRRGTAHVPRRHGRPARETGDH